MSLLENDEIKNYTCVEQTYMSLLEKNYYGS